MKNPKWKVVALVAIILVGCGLIARTMTTDDGLEISEYYFLVDVETGEVFRADKRIPLQSPNPNTGKTSLIRICKADDGSFFVSERDMALLGFLDKEVVVSVIDVKTGEIKTPLQRVVDYPRK